jgi:hypothetical protein
VDLLRNVTNRAAQLDVRETLFSEIEKSLETYVEVGRNFLARPEHRAKCAIVFGR